MAKPRINDDCFQSLTSSLQRFLRSYNLSTGSEKTDEEVVIGQGKAPLFSSNSLLFTRKLSAKAGYVYRLYFNEVEMFRALTKLLIDHNCPVEKVCVEVSDRYELHLDRLSVEMDQAMCEIWQLLYAQARAAQPVQQAAAG